MAAPLRGPALRSHPDARLGWYLLVATIPIGVRLVFEQRDRERCRDLWLIGTVLIVFALALGYADRHGRHEREISELSTRDGILIGLAQSLALIRRVALATMSAGLPLGLERPRRPSSGSCLAIPAVASGVFQLEGIISGEEGGDEPLDTALATVIAFVVGYAAIAWFLRYSRTTRAAVRDLPPVARESRSDAGRRGAIS